MSATMTSADVGQTLVYRELWYSLAGAMRCYGGDPNLQHGPVVIEEPAPGRLRAVCGSARLDLMFDFASGTGHWKLESGERRRSEEGGFALSVAGTVRWNRQEMEFDRAAIEWVEWLTQSAKQAAIRVQEV